MDHVIRCVSCHGVLNPDPARDMQDEARCPVTHTICPACLCMLEHKVQRVACQARSAAQLSSSPA